MGRTESRTRRGKISDNGVGTRTAASGRQDRGSDGVATTVHAVPAVRPVEAKSQPRLHLRVPAINEAGNSE